MMEEQSTLITSEVTSSLPVTTAPEVVPQNDNEGAAVTTTIETTVTTSDVLLHAVKDIRELQSYQFGITIVIIAVLLARLIVNIFFKGV